MISLFFNLYDFVFVFKTRDFLFCIAEYIVTRNEWKHLVLEQVALPWYLLQYSFLRPFKMCDAFLKASQKTTSIDAANRSAGAVRTNTWEHKNYCWETAGSKWRARDCLFYSRPQGNEVVSRKVVVVDKATSPLDDKTKNAAKKALVSFKLACKEEIEILSANCMMRWEFWTLHWLWT